VVKGTVPHLLASLVFAVAATTCAQTGSNLGRYGMHFTPAVVSGKVTNASSVPVAAADVTTTHGHRTVTGMNGEYALYLDAPGLYTLTASKGVSVSTNANVTGTPAAPTIVNLQLPATAGGTAWVAGFVPDWNQPTWHGANGPNGGPVAGWAAWCAPTAVANLLGHWQDFHGRAVADGPPFPLSGVPWGLWPAWQDHQANGAATRGTAVAAPDDLGWYFDTNRQGDPGHGNGPAHTGTKLGNVSPGPLGLNSFLAAAGQTVFVAYTHGAVYSDPQTQTVADTSAGFDELKREVDADRTAVAHFTHWNLALFTNGPAAAPSPTTESEYGLDYYTFGLFPPGSDPELGEEWNNEKGANGLGHAVTVVGYIPAGTPDDPSAPGNTDWVIVHDNWSGTPRNVAVPIGPEWAANTIVYSDIDGDGIPDQEDPDADGDGMPNDYENAHGFDSLDPSDADEDADNDGATNGEERIADTNPTNALSVFGILSISNSTAETAFTVWSSTARVYSALYSTGPLSSNLWSILTSNVPGVGAPLIFRDTNAVPSGRFYRATVTEQ